MNFNTGKTSFLTLIHIWIDPEYLVWVWVWKGKQKQRKTKLYNASQVAKHASHKCVRVCRGPIHTERKHAYFQAIPLSSVHSHSQQHVPFVCVCAFTAVWIGPEHCCCCCIVDEVRRCRGVGEWLRHEACRGAGRCCTGPAGGPSGRCGPWRDPRPRCTRTTATAPATTMLLTRVTTPTKTTLVTAATSECKVSAAFFRLTRVP